jgi:transcriptional adapter 2-alpha
VGLDLTGLPGVESLSSKERELCTALRLLPAHYLVLKDHLMRQGEAHGYLSRQEVSKLRLC